MKSLTASLALLAASAGAALAAAPLVEAAKRDDHDAAMALVRAGEDVTAAEQDGTTPLLWATHNEDADLVAALLDAGADPDVVNDYGALPLQEAAAVGNAAIIDLLLEAGADPESTNAEGQTALMAAVRTGRIAAVRRLLEAGADVNARESWGGQTALMWAVVQDHPEMAALLVEAGADVNARAVERDWARHVTSEPRIKEMHPGGLTPLLYAAREGQTEAARILIEAGADIDMADPEGVTPLMLTLMNLHFDTAAYLIEAGADIHLWDWWGRTALFQAVDMARLVDEGIPTINDASGLDVARMLLERGAEPNMRLKLIPPERSMVIDRVMNDHILEVGATPLLRAAWGAEPDMVALLLEHGALVNMPNGRGNTPLIAAAAPGGTRISAKSEDDIVATLERLIAAGAEVDARNHQGQTALHLAVRQSMPEVVRFLADQEGAPLLARDDRDLDLMDYASGRADTTEFGNTDVVGVLPEMQQVVLEVLAAHGIEEEIPGAGGG